MKAVVVREHGDVDRLLFEERPAPVPAPGEVRVQLRAAALNHLDLWLRRGVPGHSFPLPLTPGCDGAGVVDAIGPGVSNVRIGDSVVLAPGYSCGACEMCTIGQDQLCRNYGILGEMRDGTCAEFIAVPARNCLQIPKGQDYKTAAAWPLTFLTAWHMLTRRAMLRPGETVLVHAAGSGVSTAAIQMANLLGATVIATAGSDEKCSRARELGAAHVINYEKGDFSIEVRKITNKRGVDVIVNHVGAKTFESDMRILTKGGRLVTCGATGGYEMKTDFRLVYFKSLSILGSTMGSLGELHEVAKLIKDARIAPVIDSVFSLDSIRDAHRRVAERAVFGKVVIEIG
ncbi:MAG: zinc-binding dehydrogenase [Planctomycetes bacterium]|nr:zinc-binding dehydrogenase [Planctomycetota bacterium]